MFERYTDRARRVITFAKDEAQTLRHNYVGTEHILLGLIHEGEGVAAKALESFGISLEEVREQIEEDVGKGEDASPANILFSERAKKVLEHSQREAIQLGHNFISTEHLLLGLIRESEGVACQVLERLGLDTTTVPVRKRVIDILTGTYSTEVMGKIEFGASAKAVFTKARELAAANGDSEVTDRHVLVAALELVDLKGVLLKQN